MNTNFKVGDTVRVTSGLDLGRIGTVISLSGEWRRVRRAVVALLDGDRAVVRVSNLAPVPDDFAAGFTARVKASQDYTNRVSAAIASVAR